MYNIIKALNNYNFDARKLNLKKSLILFLFISQIQLRLNAKFDTLQEWTTACFKECKEYCSSTSRGIETVHKSVLANEHNEAFQEFDEMLDKVNKKIEAKNGIVKHPYAEKVNVAPGAKICLIGDIHGALHSLLRNLLRLKALGYLNNNFSIPSDKNFYLIFLGDYIDRGAYGVEVIYTLLKLKSNNMDRVFLLRGNHEGQRIGKSYGFTNEQKKKFCRNNIMNFDKFCDLLPITLFVGSGDDWIQCCHGGIDKDYKDEKLISTISNFIKDQNNIIQLPKNYTGFTWTDFLPKNSTKGQVKANRRTKRFRADLAATNDFLNKYKLRVICRGHQHNRYGIKIGGETHWKDKQKLVKKAKNLNGFLINDLDYPVVTFSAASADLVQLPYDCFGIITVGNHWNEWRLLPYEFFLDNSKRNNSYTRITGFNRTPTNLEDPIKFEFTGAAADIIAPKSIFIDDALSYKSVEYNGNCITR